MHMQYKAQRTAVKISAFDTDHFQLAANTIGHESLGNRAQERSSGASTDERNEMNSAVTPSGRTKPSGVRGTAVMAAMAINENCKTSEGLDELDIVTLAKAM